MEGWKSFRYTSAQPMLQFVEVGVLQLSHSDEGDVITDEVDGITCGGPSHWKGWPVWPIDASPACTLWLWQGTQNFTNNKFNLLGLALSGKEGS